MLYVVVVGTSELELGDVTANRVSVVTPELAQAKLVHLTTPVEELEEHEKSRVAYN